MRRLPTLIAAAAAIALALAPSLADARAGGGRSFGSSGSRTYSAPPPTRTAPSQARPVERSMTEPGRTAPNAAAAPGAAATRPAAAAPGGFFSRSPFMAGLMGGLIGAGIGGLLFGGGLFGGLGSFAGFLGFLFQIALIAGLIWLVLRLVRGGFRGREAAPAGGVPPNLLARGGAEGGMGGGARPGVGGAGYGSSGAAAAPAPLDKADFDAFERLLAEVNAAWSHQDLAALQRVATPEMVQYFADDLADLASRGLRNEVRDAKLEQGDLADAWQENGRDYARVAMRFSLIDVTRRVSDGAVVEGDASHRTEATEIWTFVRSRGGAWLLSAIQQTG